MRFQRTLAISGGLFVIAGSMLGGTAANAAATPAAATVQATAAATVAAAPAFAMPATLSTPTGVGPLSLKGNGSSEGTGASIPSNPSVGWPAPPVGPPGSSGGGQLQKHPATYNMRSGWERLHSKERGLPKPLAPWNRRDIVRKGGDTILEGAVHSYKYDAGSPCLDKVIGKETLFNGDKVLILPQWIDHQVTVMWHPRNNSYYVPGETTFHKAKNTWECGSGLQYRNAEYTCPVDIVNTHIVGPWGAKLPGNEEGTTIANIPQSLALDRPLRRIGDPSRREVKVERSRFGKDQLSGFHEANKTPEEKIDVVMDPKKCGRGDHRMTYEYWFDFESGWDAVGNYSLYADLRTRKCNVFVANPWTFTTGYRGTDDRKDITTNGKLQWGGCESPKDRALPLPSDPEPQKNKIEGAVWCEPPLEEDVPPYGWRETSKGPKAAGFNFASRFAECEKEKPHNLKCVFENDQVAEVRIANSVKSHYSESSDKGLVTKDTVVPADGRYLTIKPLRPTLINPNNQDIVLPKPSSHKIRYSVSRDPEANPYEKEPNSPDEDGFIDGDPEEPVWASEEWDTLLSGWHRPFYLRMYRTPNYALTGSKVKEEPFRVEMTYYYLVEWWVPVMSWGKKDGGLHLRRWAQRTKEGSCPASVQWRTASARNAN